MGSAAAQKSLVALPVDSGFGSKLPFAFPLKTETMQIIQTNEAPIPAGHYAQATVHAGIIYVAGQLAIDPVSGEIVGEDPGSQTEYTLRNVEAILKAAGSGLEHVLSTTVYIISQQHWEQVNAAYASVMGDHRPARATVPVKELKSGCFVEIQAIAVQP